MAKKAAKKVAQNDMEFLDNLYAELVEETGGQLLCDIENCKYFIDTGSLALNFICSGRFIGGGVPGARITEFYGPSASSKSLVATNILHGAQQIGAICIYLDTENALNAEFAERAGHINTKRLLRHTPETLERAFSKVYATVKFIREVKKVPLKIPIVVVYDSISASPCEREWREIHLPENYTKEQFKAIVGAHEQPGERAKIASKELRKINPLLEKMNVCLTVINQTRQAIGVLYGNPETKGGGGKALEFYCSCIIRTQAQKKIENTKLEKVIGVNVKMKNMKNRSFRPFVETQGIQLYFDTGIHPIGGLLSLLIQSERVSGTGGNYKVLEPWAKGEEISFKASKARNDVPMDLLLRCPQLIDAESTEQVQAYFAQFGDLGIIDSADVKETEAGEEADIG